MLGPSRLHLEVNLKRESKYVPIICCTLYLYELCISTIGTYERFFCSSVTVCRIFIRLRRRAGSARLGSAIIIRFGSDERFLSAGKSGGGPPLLQRLNGGLGAQRTPRVAVAATRSWSRSWSWSRSRSCATTSTASPTSFPSYACNLRRVYSAPRSRSRCCSLARSLLRRPKSRQTVPPRLTESPNISARVSRLSSSSVPLPVRFSPA